MPRSLRQPLGAADRGAGRECRQPLLGHRRIRPRLRARRNAHLLAGRSSTPTAAPSSSATSPDAVRFEDVREVGAGSLDPVDLVCGGFPCQDLSAAGRGAGIDGARSGLWSEFARIVCELRPRYVVVENVPALLTGKGKRWERGPIGRVLGDLAEARYDAEWACLSAGEFGAPHLRKRVWIVAYPARDAEAGAAAQSRPKRQRARAGGERSRAEEMADADAERQPGRAGEVVISAGRRQPAERSGKGADVPDAAREQHEGRAQALGGSAGGELRDHWAAEPGVGRVADGVPRRVDRLAALGNALVPQIAEWIGRRILDYERTARRGAVS
jgi:DNA (cytosine-5)-methyltransferase 1